MMKPEEVAKYLKEHPEFFENHAEALAEITIPHPHGGRAIPISERQTLTLREKNRQLEDFAVPHVAVRVWRAGGKHGELPEFKPLDNASRDFVSALAHPHCGAHATVDTAGLFGDAGAHLKSFSYIPLRDTETFGLLTLASEDAQRFYPEMGTLYLTRLGDLVGSSIARHLRFQ
jgi:uncharacterized protein YigA (DUF484 family)